MNKEYNIDWVSKYWIESAVDFLYFGDWDEPTHILYRELSVIKELDKFISESLNVSIINLDSLYYIEYCRSKKIKNILE